MNPYYEIVRIMRQQSGGAVQLAEGVVRVEPLRVEVMGETVTALFANHIATGNIVDGQRCLVYAGDGEYVVLAVL